MNFRDVFVFDNKTQKARDTVLLEVPKRRSNKFRSGCFCMINQEKMQEIIQSKKYTGETLRLLLFFMSIVEYDNRIKAYTQKQIAEKLDVKQPQISRALKELEKDQIIIKKDGKDIYFNDNFVWKGKT